jgi:Icc protein
MKKIIRRDFLKKGACSLAAGAFVSFFPGTVALGNSLKKEKGSIQFLHVTDTHLDLGKPETVKWTQMLVNKINQEYAFVDFVLFGGDNFNNNAPGTDDATKFKKIAGGLNIPWYSVRGNKESSPNPKGDQLNQSDYADMFFPPELMVAGRDWKLEKDLFTILGIDTTVDHRNNGIFTSESLGFVENELKSHPDRRFIIMSHQTYGNFWAIENEKAVSQYVINNLDEVKSRLFKYPNLILTLSGHKHLDYVGKENHIHMISTVGFVVPQNANENDHQFRYVKIHKNEVSEKLVSIL